MKSFKWVAGMGIVSQWQEKEIRSTVGHSLTTVSISLSKGQLIRNAGTVTKTREP